MGQVTEVAPELTEDLVAFCFRVLLAALLDQPEPSLGGTAGAIATRRVAGLFVTWKSHDQ
eukprot:CAMPEP_0172735974 /NCGR_PEP_ID=MMETSP1074-20121228/113821_1 /TAXON_ID=2916 /ORGANISM="Ceratium fusus, Strain PA161109" /LENGTH=59 /DNA_ID=CAMNT_0013565083 /DNA_START=22 /DNA_END=198 /DNA_ORIENTATION=+